MSVHTRKDGNSWLDVVAGLLTKEPKQRPRRFTRRLAAEHLERRMVLSTASVDAPAVADEGSLAEYIAQEHPMGPIAPPADTAAAAEGPAAGGTVDQTMPGLDEASFAVAPADQFFVTYQGEGVGEGEGSGSGSGSSAPPDEPPDVTGTATTDENGAVSISGAITDDGGLENLTVAYDGPGTFSFDANGNFIVNMGTPEGSGVATVTVTDANGQTTTYSFTYGS